MNITKLLPVIGLAAGLVASAPALAGSPPRGGPVLSHNWTVGMNGRGSAAIVARASGAFYDMIVAGRTYNEVGEYGYGDNHYCMVEVQPNNGALLVRLANGKTVAALNDGDFAPDLSRGKCDTIAANVPPGLAGPAPAVPVPSWAGGSSSAGVPWSGLTFFEGFILSIVGTALLSRLQYGSIKNLCSPENKAALWKQNQHNYSFSEATGEWHKITDRGFHGVNLVLKTSRGDRVVIEQTAIKGTNWVGPFCILCGLASCCVVISVNYSDESALVGVLFAFFGVSMFALDALFVFNVRKALVIDPPAVQPDQKPFGEATPFADSSNGSDETDFPMMV